MLLESHSDVMLATSSIMPSLLSNKWFASGIIIKSLDRDFNPKQRIKSSLKASKLVFEMESLKGVSVALFGY